MLTNSFKKLPKRIERMMMNMQEFTFTIEYSPGKDNICDYLSRHASSEDMTRTPCTICKKCDFEEEIVKSVCGSFKLSVPKAMWLEELKLETSRDEILRKVKRILELNSRQQFKQDPNIRPYFQINDELSAADDLICRGSRIIIRLTLQDRIMEVAHEGHLGIVKSKRFFISTCWFLGLDKKMELMIKRCLPCQAVSAYNVREPLELSPLPDYP